MIEDTIGKIETRIQGTEAMKEERRRELLQLLGTLKSEVAELSKTHEEQAQSIAGFTEVSTHEATRTEQNPELLKLSLEGLGSSVQGFEESHPRLVQIVQDRKSTRLNSSHLGISYAVLGVLLSSPTRRSSDLRTRNSLNSRLKASAPPCRASRNRTPASFRSSTPSAAPSRIWASEGLGPGPTPAWRFFALSDVVVNPNNGKPYCRLREAPLVPSEGNPFPPVRGPDPKSTRLNSS